MNGSIRCDESMVVPRFTNDESVWVRTLRSRGRPSASKLLASDTVRVSPAGSATPAMPACRLINEPAASTPAAARPAAAEPAAAVPVHDNAAARLFSNPPGDYGSMVGRCKLDPSLKAPCFRSLNPESAFIAFNLNLVSELAPLQHGERARGDGGVGGRPRARRHVGGAQRVFLRPWRRAR